VAAIATVAASLPPAEARRRFDHTVVGAGELIAERPRDVLGNTTVGQQLDAGKMTQVFAPARVFSDSPDKVAGVDLSTEGPTVTNQTLALFAAATGSVSIVSPYFIPGERGMEMMRRAGSTQETGRITVITNSLGATDEPLVYAEYAKYRVPMLQAGVRIFEVAPTLRRTGPLLPNFGKSLSRLHAKVAVIDGRQSFIGSMNLDGRSALQNTEVGLVIDSTEIAATLDTLAKSSLTLDAWRLQLSHDGSRVEWVEAEPDGSVKVHRVEPDDSVWLRLQFWLLLPFVNARQL
jgi:putative cardiolipin synthase